MVVVFLVWFSGLVIFLGVVAALGIVGSATAAVALIAYGAFWIVRESRRSSLSKLEPHVRERLLEIRQANERSDLSERRRRGYTTTFGRRR